MTSPTTAVAAITAKIGRLLDECNRPTPVEAKAPMPICIKPSSADALPIFLLNGASAIAAAFGKAMPQNGK